MSKLPHQKQTIVKQDASKLAGSEIEKIVQRVDADGSGKLNLPTFGSHSHRQIHQ